MYIKQQDKTSVFYIETIKNKYSRQSEGCIAGIRRHSDLPIIRFNVNSSHIDPIQRFSRQYSAKQYFAKQYFARLIALDFVCCRKYRRRFLSSNRIPFSENRRLSESIERGNTVNTVKSIQTDLNGKVYDASIATRVIHIGN